MSKKPVCALLLSPNATKQPGQFQSNTLPAKKQSKVKYEFDDPYIWCHYISNRMIDGLRASLTEIERQGQKPGSSFGQTKGYFILRKVLKTQIKVLKSDPQGELRSLMRALMASHCFVPTGQDNEVDRDA